MIPHFEEAELFIGEELDADIDMALRYDMELCLTRAPPQVHAPTRHTHPFFPFAGKPGILAKVFQDILCS